MIGLGYRLPVDEEIQVAAHEDVSWEGEVAEHTGEGVAF